MSCGVSRLAARVLVEKGCRALGVLGFRILGLSK